MGHDTSDLIDDVVDKNIFIKIVELNAEKLPLLTLGEYGLNSMGLADSKRIEMTKRREKHITYSQVIECLHQIRGDLFESTLTKNLSEHIHWDDIIDGLMLVPTAALQQTHHSVV